MIYRSLVYGPSRRLQLFAVTSRRMAQVVRMIPPPAGGPKAGRCSKKVTMVAATASPAGAINFRSGEAQQVVG